MLVVSWAQEYLRVQFPPCVAAVHHLVAPGLVAVVVQQLRDLRHVDSVVEWSGVSDLSFVSANLALQTLNQVTNGHSGGDGVGVDDDVGGDSFAGEQHVLLSVLDTAGSFLSVSTGKLVSDLWDPDRPHSDLGELVSLHIKSQHDLVHNSCLRVTEESTGDSLGVSLSLPLQLVVILRQGDRLADDDVLIQLVVDGRSHALTSLS